MEKNKVSIIVGIYNSAEFLRKGLNSLMNQTWKNIEVLMMDDGSTDESPIICDEYQSKDNRFIAIHKKNSGVCDSRNKGLEIATGDYVCFMDGDDWFSYDFVEYMMSIIMQTKTKMVLSRNLFTTRDQVQVINDKVEIWNSEKAIVNIIYPYMILGPWNKLYSMDIIRKYNIYFPEHWFGETLHFANTVAYYSKYIGVGQRKVYNYRLNNLNSGTTQFNVETRLLSLDNANKLRNQIFADNKKIMNAIEWHLYANHFTLITNIIGSNQMIKYRNEYNNSKKYLLKHFAPVLLKSDIKMIDKVKVVVQALFTKTYANRLINNHRESLKNDVTK